MKDGDIVYSIGGPEDAKYWVQGNVIEFEDTILILWRDEKGKICMTECLDGWALDKQEAKNKMHKLLVTKLAKKLKSIEEL